MRVASSQAILVAGLVLLQCKSTECIHPRSDGSNHAGTSRRKLQAVVAGATGLVGRALVKELIHEGSISRVTALTRQQNATVKELYAKGSYPEMLDKVRLVHVPDFIAFAAAEQRQPSVFNGVDLAFACMRSSRRNAEVKESIAARGAIKGYAEWLQLVDVLYNTLFAKAAAMAGSKYLARLSAACADTRLSSPYCHHQGVADESFTEVGSENGIPVSLFRPKALRDGEKEQRKPNFRALPAKLVAEAMVVDALSRGRGLSKGEKVQRVVRHDDVPAVVGKKAPWEVKQWPTKDSEL